MKYCLSARQSAEYLKKADEILFQYRDREAIGRISRDYPKATIILQCMYEKEIDWGEITQFQVLTKGNLVVEVADLPDFYIAKELGLKAFFAQPVYSFYQLRELVYLEVEYLRLGAPLFFDLEKVRNITNIPIRVTPNVAGDDDFLERENNLYGTWIRPEDMQYYEEYVDVCEFKTYADTTREQAFYRVYVEEKEWGGHLDLLILDLGLSPTGRLFMPEFGPSRVKCGQMCMAGKPCRICEKIVRIADEQKLQEYKDAISQ